MMKTIAKLFAKPKTQPDARVPVLVQELLYAQASLERAAESMKRNLVTPETTKRTKLAALRCEQVLGQLGLAPPPDNRVVRQ